MITAFLIIFCTLIERFHSFFTESAGFGTVAVHVKDVEIALGGATRRICQPMAVGALVHALLAEAASLGAATNDHLVIAIAFSDSCPNLAHWNGVFASPFGARSSAVAAIAAAITAAAAIAAAAAAAATHRSLDPLNITRNSSPNSGHSGDVASSVSERCDSGDFVFSVGATAGDRPTGIPHAAADATIAEAVVKVLPNRAPFTTAVGIAPDFRSDRLEFFVPILFF